MFRLTLACAALLLAAPEPAPETAYTLRIEEYSGSYKRTPSEKSAPDPQLAPTEELIHQIDIRVVRDRDFQVTLQQSKITRELSGTLTDQEEGGLLLKIAYSSQKEIEPGGSGFKEYDGNSAKSNVGVEFGKRICIGRFKLKSTGGYSRSFWVSVLKPEEKL